MKKVIPPRMRSAVTRSVKPVPNIKKKVTKQKGQNEIDMEKYLGSDFAEEYTEQVVDQE